MMAPGQSRVLAVGLLAALVAAGLVLVLLVAGLHGKAFARLAAAERAQAAQAALLARRDSLESEVAALREAGSATDVFLPDASEAQAAATLQELVKAAVVAGGAGLDSLETLPAEAREGARSVGVRARLTADVPGLQALLHRLESGRPLVVVEGLFVRARASLPERGARHLDVRLDARGSLAGEAS